MTNPLVAEIVNTYHVPLTKEAIKKARYLMISCLEVIDLFDKLEYPDLLDVLTKLDSLEARLLTKGNKLSFLIKSFQSFLLDEEKTIRNLVAENEFFADCLWDEWNEEWTAPQRSRKKIKLCGDLIQEVVNLAIENKEDEFHRSVISNVNDFASAYVQSFKKIWAFIVLFSMSAIYHSHLLSYLDKPSVVMSTAKENPAVAMTRTRLALPTTRILLEKNYSATLKSNVLVGDLIDIFVKPSMVIIMNIFFTKKKYNWFKTEHKSNCPEYMLTL